MPRKLDCRLKINKSKKSCINKKKSIKSKKSVKSKKSNKKSNKKSLKSKKSNKKTNKKSLNKKSNKKTNKKSLKSKKKSNKKSLKSKKKTNKKSLKSKKKTNKKSNKKSTKKLPKKNKYIKLKASDIKKMSNMEVRKYINSLPRYIKGTSNYDLWKNGLGPNNWYYNSGGTYSRRPSPSYFTTISRMLSETMDDYIPNNPEKNRCRDNIMELISKKRQELISKKRQEQELISKKIQIEHTNDDDSIYNYFKKSIGNIIANRIIDILRVKKRGTGKPIKDEDIEEACNSIREQLDDDESSLYELLIKREYDSSDYRDTYLQKLQYKIQNWENLIL